jgi:hypothetical protein
MIVPTLVRLLVPLLVPLIVPSLVPIFALLICKNQETAAKNEK